MEVGKRVSYKGKNYRIARFTSFYKDEKGNPMLELVNEDGTPLETYLAVPASEVDYPKGLWIDFSKIKIRPPGSYSAATV